jgi:hypothetical protein
MVKLLWCITPADENDMDIKHAVEAKLSMLCAGAASDSTTEASGQLLWPQVNLQVLLKVEAMLDESTGICLEGDPELSAWFVTILDSRPAVP